MIIDHFVLRYEHGMEMQCTRAYENELNDKIHHQEQSVFIHILTSMEAKSNEFDIT